ncbi:50S ribosomal protein L15 [Candidatus Ornithobacterium hominis]|uniref:Large ribosomal subunit protein uL15 n=1 Tax=Candidatus Ornithobacterium hominis TaxID=2497989 RepID=A0A383TXU3_9FLAO|nr:50S ribosomal protein L15 [Candidatus Ornithobacterium hominis]MCT7904038.1 50S ribosomal protein L15 [Candidatus Ornithobacterium hominis]SZD72424.1 50S ribosomal protein L15 [Candidatus Ornithobacterium hominis]
MELRNLRPALGSTKNKYRKGRGEGSGNAGTSGRGHKGAKSRSGYSKKIGFEGGQMPLQRRVPKFGFNSRNKKVYKTLNLDTIQKLIDEKRFSTDISKEDIVNAGFASKNDLIKILGRGELKSAVNITVDAFTKSAKEVIEKSGGSANIK